MIAAHAHSAATVSRELRAFADPARAKAAQRYFKTGPGEYGEGDKFLGVTVPQIRQLARVHRSAKLPAVRKLLTSKWHEERALALIILANAYPKASEAERKEIFDLYLTHTAHIDNWDLVDCSADRIVGAHLPPDDWRLLTKLARSPSVWERRIAVISTRRWIKEGDFMPTFELARMLLADPHDLIHKATGWMLRDVADRDRCAAEAFLTEHLARMPRTMLRYAIEKFPEALRKRYLSARAPIRG